VVAGGEGTAAEERDLGLDRLSPRGAPKMIRVRRRPRLVGVLAAIALALAPAPSLSLAPSMEFCHHHRWAAIATK